MMRLLAGFFVAGFIAGYTVHQGPWEDLTIEALNWAARPMAVAAIHLRGQG
jgi:hypothetical protein